MRALAISGLVVLLSACSEQGDMEDLYHFTAQEPDLSQQSVPVLPAILPGERFTYRTPRSNDPFSESNVVPEKKVQVAAAPPDQGRPKEALEYFPLDSLKMVGTLDISGEKWAIVRAPDDTIHRVRPGLHMGMNFGRIDRVTDGAISLTELVKNTSGGWEEAASSVVLSE